jgi:hypothetical protein
MSLHKGDKVEVLRNIQRVPSSGGLQHVPYASAGERGVVLEVFRVCVSKSEARLHVKVIMDGGGVKTFRIKSVGRVQ